MRPDITTRSRWITLTRLVPVLGLLLAACGAGDTGGATNPSLAVSEPEQTGTAGRPGADGNPTAKLTAGSEVYTWTSDQANTCEIEGMLGHPSADFGIPPSQGGEGPWVQFLDRGDGGVNFSAVLEGEEYSGTGPGESEKVGTNSFRYTGTMNRSGEPVEVVLEVSC
jgi:hypothetical protein